MAEPNPFLGKSSAELKRQFDLITQAMEAEASVKNVVAAAALKWGFLHLKGGKEGESKLGAALDAISTPSLPREALLAKPAGLSESQIDLLKKSVEKALEGIKLSG